MRYVHVVIFLFFISYGCTSSTDNQVPIYKARLFKADSIDLQEVTKGKITILVIWSIFCGPCLKELPEIQTVYNHYKPDNRVTFLTLALNTNEELSRFSSPTNDNTDIYRKVFVSTGLKRFTIPTLIGTQSPYQITDDIARLSDTKTIAQLKQLFKFEGVPVTRIYNREGEVIFEQKGVKTSASGLRQHRINLISKVDSLLTL